MLEGLVAQLLLLANHVAEFVERLLHVVVAVLAGPRHLQVFQHLLELFEQLFGGILVAGARQPLHAIQHVLQVLLAEHPGVGIELPGQLLFTAQTFLQTAWWMSVFPGLAICIAVIGLNLLADGLNEIVDPRATRAAGLPA